MSRDPDEINPGFQTQRAPADLLARATHRAGVPRVGARQPGFVGLAAGMIAGIVGAVAVMGGGAEPSVEPASAAEEAPGHEQLVRFVLHAPAAHDVRVAGTWNGWDTARESLHAGPDGVFFATLSLPPGQHEYQFIVDGAWMADPASPLSRDDGFGRRNSVLSL
ncbi:hypothetical protein LBMAG42_28930 [Deltaproteobacteria bacterium]|nr:hypothetical protein LBMAG42_28930 [Deltaproteobacteria bacterium]